MFDQKEYYLKNREELLEKDREYYLTHRDARLVWQHDYYARTREESLARSAKYRRTHVEETRLREQRYYQSHGVELRKNAAEWRKRNRLQQSEYHTLWRQEHREQITERHISLQKEVLTHYGGGKLACVICGESHLACLSIDHVNNNGAAERRSVGYGGLGFYSLLKSRGFPDGYQTLCMNCQAAKSYTVGASGSKAWRRKLKLDVLTYYGSGACACVECGETRLNCLTIDHVNGGGTRHRSQLGFGGFKFYTYLKRNGFPDNYQTLCMNCQFQKRKERKEYRFSGERQI